MHKGDEELQHRRRSFELATSTILLLIFFINILLVMRVPNIKRGTTSATRLQQTEYIMWSEQEAHFADCRKRLLGNEEWGETVAPLVDKITAKEFARQWSPSVQIVPTLTHFDTHNMSLLTPTFLRTLPQPYIVKPTHMSGMVAGVVNNTYHCLKDCPRRQRKQGPIHDDATALSVIQRAKQAMNYDFSTRHNEMQYHSIPPRIILETYLPMDKMKDVTEWYIVHGTPVFVNMECSDPSHPNNHNERVFLTTDYQPLPMTLSKHPCPFLSPKPKTWELMRKIAEEELGPHLPGVVRLDLYAGETQVFFSEFTFTTAACAFGFHPRVADGLLYALDHEHLSPTSMVTPDFVRNTISGTSWVHLPFPPGESEIRLNLTSTAGFPSPIDLCQGATNSDHHKSSSNCLSAAKTVAKDDLRCIVSRHQALDDRSSKSITFAALGAPHTPTLPSVWSRVATGKILTLLFLLLVLIRGKTTKRNKNEDGKPVTPHIQYNRLLANVLYLVAMAVYMYCTTPSVVGMFSSHSITHVAQESFRVFQVVHPISSPLILLSHFGSYWTLIAAWKASSLQSMLFWQCVYELVTTFVNEYTHHTEMLHTVRCTRLVFIDTVQRYVLDDVIRAYVLQPFFVYGYLLPKSALFQLGLLTP